jgi:hypothetical protein
MQTKYGSELKAGDVISTWFGKQRIVALVPYTGPLSYLWEGNARLASLAPSTNGMTIDPNESFDVE